MNYNKRFYVYILSNFNNKVLYVGLTNNIVRRVGEHKDSLVKGFTQKYNVTKLIYFEEYGDFYSAMSREKQLKKWKRLWKEELIKTSNPNFEDLSNNF